MKNSILKYGISIASFIIVYILAKNSASVFHLIEGNTEHHLLLSFFLIAIVFILSSITSHIGKLTKMPSFVIAIFLGIAAGDLIKPIVESHAMLSILVGLGATLILFGGGLETPYKSFKKLLVKIMILSFVGLFITAILTSNSISILSSTLGINISVTVAVLLGAVLSSTDPAAIIPILKKLRFKNRSVKDIIISESAVTDVTGTLVTLVFLGLIINSGFNFEGVNGYYMMLGSKESLLILCKQIGFGVILGVIGYGLLELLMILKKKHKNDHEADISFFLFVPILIFVLALLFGGSGYLASFIAGLLFHMHEHLKETENFFNNLIEGFMKPMIFLLLGALVDVQSLIKYAPLGILLSLVFMYIIRPIAVYISLTFFTKYGNEKLSFKDLAFISFVRETGAIPAVLLVTIMSLNIPNTEGLLELGMWVILSTLIIGPSLTPYVAKKLGVAEIMKDEENIKDIDNEQIAMLVTRGHGFVKRLPQIIKFSKSHHIKKIILLVCLEEKYTADLEKEIISTAKREFDVLRDRMSIKELEFTIISRKGLLKDNIDVISEHNKNNSITMLFAGKKILDYHLEEIKSLSIPITFVD